MRKNKLFGKSKKLGKGTLAIAAILVTAVCVTAGVFTFFANIDGTITVKPSIMFDDTLIGEQLEIPLDVELFENENTIATHTIKNMRSEAQQVNITITGCDTPDEIYVTVSVNDTMICESWGGSNTGVFVLEPSISYDIDIEMAVPGHITSGEYPLSIKIT
jgi:hypothetical protein